MTIFRYPLAEENTVARISPYVRYNDTHEEEWVSFLNSLIILTGKDNLVSKFTLPYDFYLYIHNALYDCKIRGIFNLEFTEEPYRITKEYNYKGKVIFREIQDYNRHAGSMYCSTEEFSVELNCDINIKKVVEELVGSKN